MTPELPNPVGQQTNQKTGAGLIASWERKKKDSILKLHDFHYHSVVSNLISFADADFLDSILNF